MRRVLVRRPRLTRLGRNRLFTPVFDQEFTFRKFFTGRFRNGFFALVTFARRELLEAGLAMVTVRNAEYLECGNSITAFRF